MLAVVAMYIDGRRDHQDSAAPHRQLREDVRDSYHRGMASSSGTPHHESARRETQLRRHVPNFNYADAAAPAPGSNGNFSRYIEIGSFKEQWVVNANHRTLPLTTTTDAQTTELRFFGYLCNDSHVIYWNYHNFSADLWNCSSIGNSTEYDMQLKHPALGIALVLFAMVTILGNILVMIAVAKERYLRTVTNYFIVSLAIADLMVGSVVMPFSIVHEMTNNIWLFGPDWCDVWHSLDVLASTASIMNLSVISLDRYWAITDPIAYPSKMSTGRSVILIALVWICSAAISFPAILWWRAVATDDVPPNLCLFTADTAYLLISSIVSFYGPVMVMTFVYWRIYKAATEQMRSIKAGAKVMTSNGVGGEVMTLRMHRGGGRRLDEHLHYDSRNNSDSDTDSPSHLMHPQDDLERPSTAISRKWKHFALSKKLTKIAREQKAAKTLGIVMGVFFVCWVPFFVANVLFGICKTDCVSKPEVYFPIFTWLGYINSGMNPIIYALSMRDFRRAFARVLCSCCPRYRHGGRRRNNFYNSTLSTSSFTVAACLDRHHHTNIRM